MATTLPELLEIAPLTTPIEAVISPPGSKSLTNRALLLASLADEGAGRLVRPLEADDTEAMRRCLRGLGVLIDDVADPWLVLGSGGRYRPIGSLLDAGASGTTTRFVTAAAILADSPVTVDGTPRMRRRPIGDLVTPLRSLGADITTQDGYPPVSVRPARLHGGEVEISGAVSSQFLSALLMIAPCLPDPLTVRLAGDRLVSAPYVNSTVETMRIFGAEVTTVDDSFHVRPGGYRKTHFEVEADASAMVYPAVAAAICGGTVTIEGIPLSSTQPDLAILDALARMGVSVTRLSDRIVIEASGDRLQPVETNMESAPDAALGLAVACLFASGPSRLGGLSTLRVKETDRLEALRTEILRVGAGAEIDGDALVITPGRLRPATIDTYDDHRMAMSFSLVALKVPGIVIRDPGCVSKTWPGFFRMLEELR